MGGATGYVCLVRGLTGGLSPRGRGNPLGVSTAFLTSGSIPAWAGQPGVANRWHIPPWVYPRVGGATSPRTLEVLNLGGLSPRGRGNPLYSSKWHQANRSIPAWAGQPVPRQLLLPIQRQLVLPVHLLCVASLLCRISAVAGDVKLQDDGVMHHPVDGGRGGHGVGKDAFPLGEDQV